MSGRLTHHIQTGLLSRLSCLLHRPKQLLWIGSGCDPSILPEAQITFQTLTDCFEASSEAQYDAVLIEPVLLEVTQLPALLQALAPSLQPGASLFYGFYALDTAKEYLAGLTQQGLPLMQPFLDMHDIADILMAEQITEVVSDNEVLCLPALPVSVWEEELEVAHVLPAIRAFAQANECSLPDLTTCSEACFDKTTIELGFVHGIYQPRLQQAAGEAHVVPISRIGGRSKKGSH